MTDKIDNEKIVDADVLNKTSANEPETNPEQEARPKKPTNKFLWLVLLIVLAVSVGGIANLYKKIQVVEDKFQVVENKFQVVEDKLSVAAVGSPEAKLNVAAQPPVKTAPQPNKAEIDGLAKKLAVLEKQTGEFAATQKILASIPQSVNQEIRKLTALEGKFSNLEQAVQTINDTTKANLTNPALLRAKPVIADGIRAATISLNLKQAAQLFQNAAIILHDMPDPQNTLTGEKLKELSKDLNAAYTPNLIEITAKIDSAIAKVDGLKFIGDNNLKSEVTDTKPVADSKFALNDLAGSVWTDIKSLVKISQDETKFVSVVANEARQAYRATIKLKLEQAKLVMLRFAQTEYDSLISSTTKMANEVFDNKNPQVINFIESLSVLAKIKVEIDSVADKLETAREIIKQ